MYRSKCQLPVREMMCIDDSPCALDISHVNEVYTPFLVCSCFFTLFFKVSVKAFLGLLLRTIWAVHMSYKNKGSITRSRQYLGKLLSCSGNAVRRTMNASHPRQRDQTRPGQSEFTIMTIFTRQYFHVWEQGRALICETSHRAAPGPKNHIDGPEYQNSINSKIMNLTKQQTVDTYMLKPD